MRPRPRPLLVLGFVALMTALWIAHSPPSPVLGRALKDAEARAKAFYGGHPLPPGWTLNGVSADSREGVVWVDVRLAGAADALTARPRAEIADAAARHCPPKADAVWTLLQRRQGLELRLADAGGRVLVAVDCRVGAAK